MSIIKINEEQLVALINKHGSYAGAAKELNCSDETVRSYVIKNNLITNAIKKSHQIINWCSDEQLINIINRHGSYFGAGKELKCDPESIRLRVLNKKLNVNIKNRRRKYDSKIFTNQDHISYYLLGAFISDGNLDSKCNRISIISKDYQWINDIKNIISSDSLIYKVNNVEAYTFRFSDLKIYNWLIKNQCTPKKSLIVKFPIIPDQYLADFIRGVFDGDGSVSCKFYHKNNRIYQKYISAYICGSSYEFMNSLQLALENKGIKCKLINEKLRTSQLKDGRIITPTAKQYRVIFYGKQIYKLSNFIYYPNNKISLIRKQNKFMDINDYYSQTSI